jgi:hypothetical protein
MTERSWQSRIPVALLMLGIVIVAYVLREHWGHALGVSPYLLLLACPLLHVFHGHGHAHHDPRSMESKEERNPGAGPSAQP